jgi:alkaline phosphatase D
MIRPGSAIHSDFGGELHMSARRTGPAASLVANHSLRHSIPRRRLLRIGAAGLGATLLTGGRSLLMPCPALAKAERPLITHGLQSGDVTAEGAMVWARTDRPARMIVDYALSDSFTDSNRIVGPAALEADDFTARLALTGLPAGQEVFYRVSFEDLGDLTAKSEPLLGYFRTAPASRRDVNFVWGGDVVGQGWGINPDRGGMTIFREMARLEPDFFLHSGDAIYADGPLEAETTLPDGSVWKNIMVEEKTKVAQTLAEFRGAYKYNLLDENLRALNAAVPILAQWDDHDVRDNWYPREILADDDRYQTKSLALLSAFGARAFHDYMPLRIDPQNRDRVYRVIHYGPLLDVFMLDMRSYRGDNSRNLQKIAGPDTAFLGAGQVSWLKQALKASKAVWKAIAADMPIGLVVPDGDNIEAVANRDGGPPLGRELEIADLLRFIKRNGIVNTVWFTADVHYTAAHFYDPRQAGFQDFEPFWEFVSGPLNAGTFGPNALDPTFGPQLKFIKAPEPGQVNLPPSAGYQFFGHVHIDGKTSAMTVTLKDMKNRDLFRIELAPAA